MIIIFFLYGFFLYQDFRLENENSLIKYSIVLTVLIMTLIFFRNKVNYQYYLVGLLFIVGADYFLLFYRNETDVAVGIFLFLIAHLFYQRLYNKNDRFFCFYLAFITIILILPISELLFRLGFIYACTLLINLILSLTLFIKDKDYSHFLAALAFVFLIICDIFILYSFFVGNLNQWIWLFYVPFLILLNLSVIKPFKKKTRFQFA